MSKSGTQKIDDDVKSIVVTDDDGATGSQEGSGSDVHSTGGGPEDSGSSTGSVSQDNDPEDSSSSSGSHSRTFTQEDVTRMMTREKQQGRNAVFNELGIDPNDTRTISMVKAIMASQKQEEEPPVAPSSELIEAQHRADIAEAKAEAMMVGAQPKYVDDIVTLATARLQESEDANFKAVISEIKEKYPVWFGKANDNDSSSNVEHRGTGASLGSASGSGSSEGNASSLGARLAASRTSRKPKSSYWNKK